MSVSQTASLEEELTKCKVSSSLDSEHCSCQYLSFICVLALHLYIINRF